MTDVEIPLTLPEPHALALAEFCKRLTFEDCARFAATTVTYDGIAESDVIWRAVLGLQRALANASYAPR